MTTADLEPLSIAVPLREDPPGVFRVGKSWVLLELVIHAFQRGQTPESIVQSFDTLTLPGVYAFVTYYLNNPEPINEYLRQREEIAEQTRDLRELIKARAQAKRLHRDQTRE
jgi:hypothetical protein